MALFFHATSYNAKSKEWLLQCTKQLSDWIFSINVLTPFNLPDILAAPSKVSL